MIKGGLLVALLWGVDSHAGWGFNPSYHVPDYTNEAGEVSYELLPSDKAGQLPDAQLRTNSFFKRFYRNDLYGEDEGSSAATNIAVRSKLLAEAIPATSLATGRNPIEGFGEKSEDMMLLKREDALWPRSDGQWEHSDFRGVAYYYNYRLYDDMCSANKGDLK